MKKAKLNREAIVNAAKCRVDDHGIFCVESSEFDMLLGAAESEGRAWEIFFELLDDLLDEYQKGNLAEYELSAAKVLGRKGGIAKTEAKRSAARANGARGGRPRKAV